MVIAGLVVLVVRIITLDKIWELIGKLLIPTVCSLVVKQVVYKIASKYIFLIRKSKILALNNFRAYNIFTYFTFFLDLFLGILSAIIRLGKSVVFAILMMPSNFNKLLKLIIHDDIQLEKITKDSVIRSWDAIWRDKTLLTLPIPDSCICMLSFKSPRLTFLHI